MICSGGGHGKTQLAAEYLQKATGYEKIVWLHAGQQLALHQITTYINALHPEESASLKETKEIVEFFYRKVGRESCVVFDNVEAEEDIEELLVWKDKSPHVIVTTRFAGWKQGEVRRLGVFNDSDVSNYAK